MKCMQWVPVLCRKPDEEYQSFKCKHPYSDFEVIVLIEDTSIPTFLGYDGCGFYQIDPCEDDEADRSYYCVSHWMLMPPAPADCLVVPDLGDQIEANFDLLEVFLT